MVCGVFYILKRSEDRPTALDQRLDTPSIQYVHFGFLVEALPVLVFCCEIKCVFLFKCIKKVQLLMRLWVKLLKGGCFIFKKVPLQSVVTQPCEFSVAFQLPNFQAAKHRQPPTASSRGFGRGSSGLQKSTRSLSPAQHHVKLPKLPMGRRKNPQTLKNP